MKSIKKYVWALLAIVVAFCFFAFKGDNHNFQLSKNLDIFNTIVKEIDMFYVDTINPEKVIQTGIDAMLKQLDPYTEYYPEESKSDLKLMTTGKYAGVGSIIRYSKKKERVTIVEPYENMPAAKAGLKAGDIIITLDGMDVLKKSVTEVSNMLRGEAGTTVMLTVERPGTEGTLDFKLERQNIQLPAISYYGMLQDSIGYVILDSFTEKCSKDMRKAIIELKQLGATSLILDLRGNGGGLLSEAVSIVNLFVPKGVKVVDTKGKIKQATNTYKTTNAPLDTEIPLVVLVDNSTASSSEIVAGALQDLDRAVILGTRTYGKGLVQVPRELPYNTNLKITTAKYYIPSGRCIQAVDYANRNEDGSVGRIPDSLTNVFKTAAGREVRDGGGITPDVLTASEKLPTILYYLVNDDVILDYATAFCIEHPTIAAADVFTLSDEDYNKFKEFVKASDFKYDQQSSKALVALKEIASVEGYLESSSAEFDALEKKLQHNLEHDLDYFSKQIKDLIADEIVKRYYFQKGAIVYSLRSDSDLNEAKRIIVDKGKYKQLLAPAN